MIQEEFKIEPKINSRFTNTQIEFMKLSASELTYEEIAAKMNVSQRTVDGYRDDLFKKLKLRSRVGLVLYAIQNGIVNVEIHSKNYVLEKLVEDLQKITNNIKAELK